MKLLGWLGLAWAMNLRCDRCLRPMKEWDGEGRCGFAGPLCDECVEELSA